MVVPPGPPPPPTKVMTFFFWIVSLSEIEDSFFFWGGGLSAENVSAPLRKPKAPSAPHWKNPSYATACAPRKCVALLPPPRKNPTTPLMLSTLSVFSVGQSPKALIQLEAFCPPIIPDLGNRFSGHRENCKLSSGTIPA